MKEEDKSEKLREELGKYRAKLRQMEVDYATGRGGSRYGDEYLETQIKVYQAMIVETMKEVEKMKADRVK